MDKQLETLKLLVKNRAYSRVEGVTLASGKSSNYYFDMKKLSLHASSLKCLSSCLVSKLLALSTDINWVAGVSIGGDPIVTGVILAALERSLHWQALLVRKEVKEHGLSKGRAVEGPFSGELQEGWLLEDVVSTGGSSLIAAQLMLNEGYRLQGVLCVLDREMGGLPHLENELKIPCQALFKASDILE